MPDPIDAGTRILDDNEAARLFKGLRALLSRSPAPPITARTMRGRAALFCKGQPVAEAPFSVDGGVVTAPLLAGAIPAALDGAALAACRLRVDVERGRGPILSGIEPLAAVSLIPGIDGLGVAFDDSEVVLSPDELLRTDLLAGHRPFPGVDVELGLDVRGALRMLALRAGVDGPTWRRRPHHLFRLRSESWVEPADPEARAHHAVALLRGHSPAPPLSPPALRSAASAAASYLLRHLDASGRFHYLYEPLVDQVIPDADDYSLPRHAGATWFLAQAGGALQRPDLVDASRRALRYLMEHAPDGCDRPAWACAGNPGDRRVDLGSTAMALLAATEYRRASGDAAFDPWARRLAAFVTSMQRDDGDFRHVYDLDADRADDRTRLLYFSGEATLALARLAADAGTSPEARADLSRRVDRALRWLAVDAYDHLAGGFFYGEDHWTCIAADAAWDLAGPDSSRERWADFCEGFAGFLERSRFSAGEGPLLAQPDLLGAYGFTPLMAPHPTPVGSRSESLISIHHLATVRGHRAVAARVAAGVRDSMGFLLAHQVRPDDTWMMPDPDAALGAFTMSDVKPQIRIDFLQHAGSSMLRAADSADLSAAPGSAAAPTR